VGSLKAKGWQRLNVPERFAVRAENFATPSGKCEFYSETAMAMGWTRSRPYIAPRESSQSNQRLAEEVPARHHLSGPPAFLELVVREHAGSRTAEGRNRAGHAPCGRSGARIKDGDTVRIFKRPRIVHRPARA